MCGKWAPEGNHFERGLSVEGLQQIYFCRKLRVKREFYIYLNIESRKSKKFNLNHFYLKDRFDHLRAVNFDVFGLEGIDF